MPTTKRSTKGQRAGGRGRGRKARGGDPRTTIFAGAAALAIALSATALLLVGKSLLAQPKVAEPAALSARPASGGRAEGPTPASGDAGRPASGVEAPQPKTQAETQSIPQPMSQTQPADQGGKAAEASPPAGTKSLSPSKPLPQAAKPQASSRPASYRRPPEPKPRPAKRGTLVFVIDDVGNNLSQLGPFLRAPFPLTFAVLPGLPYTTKAAVEIRAAGKELILHQPMEAQGGQNPGPRAIYRSTPPEEAARLVEENLDEVPGAVGLNNHEGSAVTKDGPLMDAVLGVAKRRGIYYLDSLTIAGTATEGAARREGIRYWERDVFLDNSPDRESIVHYIEVGKKKAEQGGSAVMIGHVWSAELAATLMELYPQLVEEGFSLSTISELMLEESHAASRD